MWIAPNTSVLIPTMHMRPSSHTYSPRRTPRRLFSNHHQTMSLTAFPSTHSPSRLFQDPPSPTPSISTCRKATRSTRLPSALAILPLSLALSDIPLGLSMPFRSPTCSIRHVCEPSFRSTPAHHVTPLFSRRSARLRSSFIPMPSSVASPRTLVCSVVAGAYMRPLAA